MNARAVLIIVILSIVFWGAPAVGADEAADTTPAPAGESPWKVRSELSFASTSGNTDTQSIAGKLGMKKEGQTRRYYATGAYLRAEDSGDETTNKLTIDGRAEVVLTERYFTFLSVGYLRDKFSGYDFRMYAGPGAGINVLTNDRHTLKGLFSIHYNHDEFSAGDVSTESYMGAKASAEYEWKALENLTFKESLDYSVSFKEGERYFIDSATAVEVKVNGRVSVGVNYTLNYQKTPPAEGLRHTDTTLLTTLIIDF